MTASTATRELLQRHTADQIRPRFDQHEAAIGNLVTTVHDPDATDEQAEDATVAFLDDWYRHPVYRKCARYGLILWTMRHRPELAEKVTAFDEYVRTRLGHTGIGDWYAKYTGTTPQPAQAFEDVPLFEVNVA